MAVPPKQRLAKQQAPAPSPGIPGEPYPCRRAGYHPSAARQRLAEAVGSQLQVPTGMGSGSPLAAPCASLDECTALAAAALLCLRWSLPSPMLQSSSSLQTVGGKQRCWGKSCGGGERLSYHQRGISKVSLHHEAVAIKIECGTLNS